MTFRQLEIFLLTVRLGTVSAAAENLGITQSGASRTLSELESNVGFPLFFRAGRGIELTQQGRQFFKQVERQFDGMDALRESVRQIRSGINQRIRIACLPTLSTSILPGAISAFLDKFPDTTLEIETLNFNESIALLKQRRVDAMLSFLMPELDGLSVSVMAQTERVFALREDHRLAELDVITPKDIEGEQIIGQIPNHIAAVGQEEVFGLREQVLDGCRQSISCHTSATRYALVAAGLAVSVAEPFAAPQFRSQGVVVRRFQPKLPVSYGFAAYSDIADSPEIACLKAAISNAFRAFAAETGIPVGE